MQVYITIFLYITIILQKLMPNQINQIKLHINDKFDCLSNDDVLTFLFFVLFN
jgi:hypothetical protein